MSKVLGIFVKFWHIFTMPAHQIWSYHVTQEANFELFYFVLILLLILGKVTKFLVEKLSTSEVISQKLQGDGKHSSSVLLGLTRCLKVPKLNKRCGTFKKEYTVILLKPDGLLPISHNALDRIIYMIFPPFYQVIQSCSQVWKGHNDDDLIRPVLDLRFYRLPYFFLILCYFTYGRRQVEKSSSFS